MLGRLEWASQAEEMQKGSILVFPEFAARP
jgi:hypothetical protein